MKPVFKEICIILLLCIAIALVFGVVFYDYIPSNKALPTPLEPYETSQEIKNEIQEEIVETKQKSVTYTVTGSDLNLYQDNDSYVAGKPNPFSASTKATEEEENSGTGTNNSGSTNTNENSTNSPSGNNGSNSNNNSSSSGKNTTNSEKYYNETGLK